MGFFIGRKTLDLFIPNCCVTNGYSSNSWLYGNWVIWGYCNDVDDSVVIDVIYVELLNWLSK